MEILNPLGKTSHYISDIFSENNNANLYIRDNLDSLLFNLFHVGNLSVSTFRLIYGFDQGHVLVNLIFWLSLKMLSHLWKVIFSWNSTSMWQNTTLKHLVIMGMFIHTCSNRLVFAHQKTHMVATNLNVVNRETWKSIGPR